MLAQEGEFAAGFSFSPDTEDCLEKNKVDLAIQESRIKYSLDSSILHSKSHVLEQEFLDSETEETCADPEQISFEDAPVPPATSFADMQLSKPLTRVLASLGYSAPTPIQGIAIPVGLTGRDICGAAETGSGKTAAFLIPVIERLLHKTNRVPGCRVLILLPTRELATQCFEVAGKLLRFSSNAIRSALLIGGEPIQQQRADLIRLRPDLIIGTPGRVIDHLHNTATFGLDRLAVLVLDEADRMLEEGFQDELEEIVKNCPRSRQTLLFSATMTDRVEQLARLSLNRPVRLFIDMPGMLARTLEQTFVRIRREEDRLAVMLSLIKELEAKHSKLIVFLPTKELCHRACILWRLASLPSCVELHGGLDQSARNANLDSFRDGAARALLCTDVAARGLDVPGVSLVVNYSLPPGLTQYTHRVGRTARAGRSGRSLSLVGESDRKLLRQIVKSTPGVRPRQRPHNPELVRWFCKFMEDAQDDLKRILRLEEEERELKLAEAELRRAESMLEARKMPTTTTTKVKEMKSGWFQKKSDKKRDRPQSTAAAGKSKKSKSK
jgi:ATP-dependent RNA helicase DDX27